MCTIHFTNSISNDSSGIQIKDNANIVVMLIKSKVGNIAYPHFIRACSINSYYYEIKVLSLNLLPSVVQNSNAELLHTIRELKEISIDEINKRTV